MSKDFNVNDLALVKKWNEGVEEAHKGRDYLFQKAEDIGVKPFLSKNNTNRERSIPAERLLQSIDQSLKRSYILDGFADYKKSKPNTRNITTQSPDCIILIKKKMFSSLADNFDPKYMDKDELHFYRASKKLFENKCFEISNYEKLTKLEKVVTGNAAITTAVAQAIYDVVNTYEETDFNQSSADLFNSMVIPEKDWEYINKNRDAIKKIKAALTLNGFSNITTWVKDTKVEEKTPLGVGTGVIELTMVKSLRTTAAIKLGGGNASFEVSDPYNLMFIDEVDIEKAIYDTSYQKFSITSYLADNLEKETDQLKSELAASRASRGASEVYYKIDISSKMYNNLTITLGCGYEVTSKDNGQLDFDGLVGWFAGNYPPGEGFTLDERNLLTRIYKNIFKIIKLRNQNYQDFRNYNKNVNYVRKMMRLYYLGKHIVQPMDEVRIFIDSQTVDDAQANVFSNNYDDLFDGGYTTLTGKAFGGIASAYNGVASLFGANPNNSWSGKASVLGSVMKTNNNPNIPALLNKTMGQIKQLTGATFNKTMMEKNLIAGKDFPIWLWNQLRPNFVSNSFGTCVFCGIVDSASESYSDGVYSLQVACKDNSYYLSQGYVPSKPSLDQYNGHLLDPLTCFDFEYDQSTGLLPSVSQMKLLGENSKLLNKPGGIRIQDGKNKGLKADLKNFNDPDFDADVAISKLNDAYADVIRRTYNPPDGFVYRWKRGIGTASVSQTGTYDGIIANKLNSEDFGLVPINGDDMPFAGQDFINIISILICGEPYNFNTFYKAATQYGSSSVSTSAFNNVDYYQGIFRRVKKLNKYWGNFIPFKKFTVDPKTFGIMLQMQSTTLSQSASIKQKQQKRIQLINKLMKVEGDSFDYNLFKNVQLVSNSPITIKTNNIAVTGDLIKQIVALDADIQMHEAMIIDTFRQNDSVKSQMITVGNNIYYEDAAYNTNNASVNYKLKQQEQNELIQRRLWQCKANIDQNLFIVGSEYDVDYDIQALMTNINSDFDIFASNWLNVSEKIRNMCETVGFECFANTQGHLEIRVPKYNRVPSSVLFDMFKKKKDYGIQIYPEFLEQTFKNQAEQLISKIEEVEDEIRLRAFAMGGKSDANDASFSQLLNGFLASSTPGSNSKFTFITDGATGTLNNIRKAINAIDSASAPDDNWGPIVIDNDTADFFDRNSSYKSVQNLLNVSKTSNNFDILRQTFNFNQILSTGYAIQDGFNVAFDNSVIRSRLASKKNLPVDKIPTALDLMPNSKKNKSPIDINNIQSQLEQLIKTRYECSLQLVNIIRNIDSAAKISSADNEILSKLLFPNLYGTENLPDFLVDMIEDESIDDFGINSGKRYILREKDIISMTYNQNNPDMTSLEISGSESGISGVDLDFGSQTKYTQVTSVDFDMWRMFGYKASTGKHFPFLTDVKTQLAPYALFLLNKERAEILQANVILRGNEFMQPGEVYFLEKRGMLFYCDSVTHTFDYSGSYKTQVSLIMGHVPGEYIPTPLDVIGKNIYNSNSLNVGNVKVARSTTDDSQTNLGVVAMSYDSNQIYGPQDYIYKGSFGARNKQQIETVAGSVIYLLNKTLPTNSAITQGITVRVFSDFFDVVDSAQFVINELVRLGIPKSKIIGTKDGKTFKSGIPFMVLQSTDKKISNVRNPSTEAQSMAGLIAQNGNNASSDKQNIIENYIIDIWLENNLMLTEQEEAKTSEKQKDVNQNKTTTKIELFNNMYEQYKKYKDQAFSNAVNIVQKDPTTTTE